MGESMEKVGKRTDRIKMDVILAAGCMLRLFYVLFSTIYDRQYDIGMIDLDAGHTVTGGHLAYIQYLYENWKLPDFDPTSVYQFNHPPLHHYLCALWMKLCSLFISNTDVLEESIQVVPFVCSLLILWFLCDAAVLLPSGVGAAFRKREQRLYEPDVYGDVRVLYDFVEPLSDGA